MNNHNHHNDEPRLDENPFDDIIRRALLHQQNVSADTARQRSVGPEYRTTIGHGTIWLGQECEARSTKQRRSRDGVSKGICQHHHRQCACKDLRHDAPGARS
uniref:Uncharacterized protein n=1 Tax=Candidatus Methanogaster sp. ANME-2c ERB4 TaxID=2759911 RepID=A0A7G9XZU1_9EURY|nr:hypothetical protein BHHPIBDN_00005 [Methanosarcinales archaeon ANME-2c ERB4]